MVLEIQDMATKKVLEFRKTDQPIKNVLDIMKEGEQEFIQKTGRNMTYSEIRELFG
jgi:hypothetical protein